MIKVANILARKGNNTISVSSDTSVIDALKIMSEKNIGSIVVMLDGHYEGIFTERDYSRKVVLKGKNSIETKVSEIMSNDFPSISLNDTIEHCMGLMSAKHIRYLPVLEDGELNGIISISDVVTETILAQKNTIAALESYIRSS